jgi:thimet oligopeptidase
MVSNEAILPPFRLPGETSTQPLPNALGKCNNGPAMRSPFFSFVVPGLLLSFAAAPLAHAQPQHADPLHAWVASSDPAGFEKWVGERVAAAQDDIAKLGAVTGPHTVENTLRPYDDAQNELSIAGNNAYLVFSLSDAAAMRDKGQAMTVRVSSAQTDLSLNQKVYAALAAIPAPADAATAHYLEHVLLEYRLAGVDKDEATRKRIHELEDRATGLSLAFSRNVQDGMLAITAAKAELDGLPADFVARLKTDANGAYILTTDQPDMVPVLSFANSAALRRRMFLAYNQRAYPKNQAVLLDLLKTCQELAGLLGFKHYADLATADHMMGTAANIQKLLDDINRVSRATAERERALVLAFARKQDPALQTIAQSDARHWMELYRRASYDFDAQSVRPYFPYDRVQAGILSTAARFFHVSFQAVKDAKVWDPSVDVFDVYDAASPNAGKLLGRIYLDMHPREGKDKWFSSSPVIPGIRGRQVPEGMLVCNFSGGKPGDPGLMDYSEVVTYFHEFGHLMHHILGGQGEWSGAGGFNVEGDFVEAPSQMLEEIFHDATILQSFGKHYQTGEVLPASLIDRMNAASAFGRGYWLQNQLIYSSFSLDVYNTDPEKMDFDREWAVDDARYNLFAHVDGTHTFASFTHLVGYFSNYYTYLLDKVIAIDFFEQFDKKNILDGPAAMRYRRAVLEPGASKPAAQLVQGFLGRPQSIDALRDWMNEEFRPQTASK